MRSLQHTPRHSAPRRTVSTQAVRRSLRRRAAVLAVSGALLIPIFSATDAAAAPPIIIGAMGDVSGLSRAIGAPLATHAYGRLEGSVPTGKMVNMRPNVAWRGVADAVPGSAVHNDVVRWANTLKSRPGRTMFAFHHEPEASGNTGMGSATDYVAGFRRVVEIFRAQGVANVDFTWQMTAWSFRVKPSDRRHAAAWYPGDSYVTLVGVDPYNFYTCGPGQGRWVTMRELADPAVAFARARGKGLVIAEFASHIESSDPLRRAQWIRDAHAWFAANANTIRAVFYFQNTIRPDCDWLVKSPADVSAFRTMATDSAFFTAG